MSADKRQPSHFGVAADFPFRAADVENKGGSGLKIVDELEELPVRGDILRGCAAEDTRDFAREMSELSTRGKMTLVLFILERLTSAGVISSQANEMVEAPQLVWDLGDVAPYKYEAEQG